MPETPPRAQILAIALATFFSLSGTHTDSMVHARQRGRYSAFGRS